MGFSNDFFAITVNKVKVFSVKCNKKSIKPHICKGR